MEDVLNWFSSNAYWIIPTLISLIGGGCYAYSIKRKREK